jgi:hypothetical protein
MRRFSAAASAAKIAWALLAAAAAARPGTLRGFSVAEKYDKNQ